jgi:phosphate transport system permease protein
VTALLRGSRSRTDRLGDSMTALCGGALALNLLLVLSLLGLLGYHGLAYFWQRPVVLLTLRDGSRVLGEISDRQPIPTEEAGEPEQRIQVKVGNRDLGGADFRWIPEAEIASRQTPPDAVLLERLEWGSFYGHMVALRRGEAVLASGPQAVARAFPAVHRDKLRELQAIQALEQGEIGEVNYALERVRLQQKAPSRRAPALAARAAALEAEYERLSTRLFALREAFGREVLVMEAADGTRQDVPVGEVVRAVHVNRLGVPGRLSLYAGRLWEFVSADPRESNTEGGIFPAIFGTVMMVFLMSFLVTPFGVLAALYLREYARQGTMVRIVRIAVNNLAGVPSIVFGVFGLGFFVYLLGGSIDRLFFAEALPSPTFGTGGILWASLTLALLTVPVVIVATEEGLAAVPRVVREGSLALGATKLETTLRVVVPAAGPGILTGMVLAMARAAGEVAPLMIVGMVKLAPALPLDHHAPFVHLERKFMHLGFHIYDIGFQSPNVEASKPLVFATALLLVVVVTLMNLTAVIVRNRLRRKYAQSAV